MNPIYRVDTRQSEGSDWKAWETKFDTQKEAMECLDQFVRYGTFQVRVVRESVISVKGNDNDQ